ncbi:DUF4158 domain-containing protein [Arthrobacter sp. A5]|uniref:DUF4158 domain-containing protein n=1 Tax=Arthrobacter sp. A5 TaxID=576926 RepID=UPI003DA957B4
MARVTVWVSGCSWVRCGSWGRFLTIQWRYRDQWPISWQRNSGSSTVLRWGSYAARSKTLYEHRWEIAQADGYRRLSVPGTAAEFRSFLMARAWTRAERPTQLFDQGVAWLRTKR